ncbi:MAG TPA: hypothetical protein VER03_14595 [Bryobacteraceae bacterium]|nr:hypothetical protein [Bryobacteraceae bacterium]
MLSRLILLLGIAAATVLGADITGIWQGQQPGRNGQVEDIAFRFKLEGSTLTGKLFGDEFDLPLAEGTLNGDQLRFTVTTTNYYNRSKATFIYTGTIKGFEIELVRERVPTPEDRPTNRPPAKQTIKLKRLT